MKKSKLKITSFDIETEPLDDGRIIEVFNPSAVKYGSTKEPEKRQEVFNKNEKNFIKKAGLYPEASRVLICGFYETDEGFSYLFDEDERALIVKIWEKFQEAFLYFDIITGHNIKKFDIEYLERRSMLHGIRVPTYLRNGRYLNNKIKDTMLEWLGSRYYKGEFMSLNTLAKIFRVPCKTESSGEFFYQWWRSGKIKKSLTYLEGDCFSPHEIAMQMFGGMKE